MRLYPELPDRRARAIVRDALALTALVLLGVLALSVHDAVDDLAVLGRGVDRAGTSVQGGFDAAAGAVDGAPVVGGPLGDALRGAGDASGGNVAELGRRGERAAHRLADVLGIVFFALPSALVLVLWLPSRVAEARALTAAARVLVEGEAGRRAVAMRAACSLPYGELLRYTRDPLGDLAAERYDALVAAAFESAGLRPPARFTSEA